MSFDRLRSFSRLNLCVDHLRSADVEHVFYVDALNFDVFKCQISAPVSHLQRFIQMLISLFPEGFPSSLKGLRSLQGSDIPRYHIRDSVS